MKRQAQHTLEAANSMTTNLLPTQQQQQQFTFNRNSPPPNALKTYSYLRPPDVSPYADGGDFYQPQRHLAERHFCAEASTSTEEGELRGVGTREPPAKRKRGPKPGKKAASLAAKAERATLLATTTSTSTGSTWPPPPTTTTAPADPYAFHCEPNCYTREVPPQSHHQQHHNQQSNKQQEHRPTIDQGNDLNRAAITKHQFQQEAGFQQQQQRRTMIAHHHHPQQQQQQQQPQQSQPIEAPVRQVMQQPDGYYQQQQPAAQYAAGDSYSQEQRFLPPSNQQQQQPQQQQFVQQRTHQQPQVRQQYVPAEQQQFTHHRVSPQQQVPPSYQESYQPQPQPQAQPRQQLIGEPHRRRMSPPNSYQQQQPVRQRSMPQQQVELGGQQYHQQQPVRPQYQQNYPTQQPAFLDQEQSYQSSSPTLLQQQLSNRTASQQRPNYRPPAPPAQQHVPVQPVRRPAPAPVQRYADEPFANSNEYSQPPQMPNEQPAQQAYSHFPPQRAPQPQPQSHQPQQAHPGQQQVVVRRHHMDQQQQPPPMLLGNPTPPLTPTSHCVPPPVQARPQQVAPAPAPGQLSSDQWLSPANQQQQHVQQPASRHQLAPQPRPPAMVQQKANFPQQQQQQQQQQYHPHQQATSQFAPQQPLARPPIVHHQQQQQDTTMRLTLPLRDTPLLGPFKLDHDAQVTSKVFHLKPHLFDSLSKSALMNPAQATVIQELQLRAHLLQGAASSSSASKQKHQHQHQHYSSSQDSLLASNSNRIARNCSWPELFQLSVNGQLVHLDTSPSRLGKAVNIFQYCHPGDNVLEIQVNDCYCSHEFVLEPVDRPTVKAFMNSCFKSRLLSQDNCLRKLQYNFGSPGFLMHAAPHNQTTIPIIVNEYISEISQQQPAIEQTKVRFSLRCLLAQQINAPSQRMRTPARGHSCKHVQCFDLENFLVVNRDRSQWHCPICYLSIPFNMLELDQLQMGISRALADNHSSDDILMDSLGQWQTYFPPPSPPAPAPGSIMHHHPQQQQQHHHPQTAKSTGIYHPQAHSNQQHNHQQQYIPQQQQQQPARPMSGSSMRPGVSPALWQDVNNVNKPKQQQQHIETIGQRRPASATSSMAQQQQQQQHNNHLAAGGELLPQAKRICTGPPQQPFLAAKPAPLDQKQYYAAGPDVATAPPQSQQHHLQHQQSSSPVRPTTLLTETTDDLSPLAAMERTIIQHEMGPPPFDPNSLTSTAPPATTSSLPKTHVGSNPVGASNSPQANAALPVVASHHQPLTLGAVEGATMIASSPAGRSSTIVAASPQQQLTPSRISDSPLQPYTMSQATSISHPATPSGLLAHGGPETPATPSNSGGCNGQVNIPQQQQSNVVHSPHVGSQTGVTNVDHQPLSNGSASAGSITSSSTMTPSSQSLGSVGMGGDSRCGTAPLQSSSSMGGLEDLMMSGGAGGNISVAGNSANGRQFQVLDGSGSSMDEKNEILMGKLMMDSAGGESLLHRAHHHNDGGELALALEEAEWKQQLDRGKSEHLANFLNEPMMNKPPSHQVQKHNTQQHLQPQQMNHPGASKMLSGGLNPSDDENSPHGSANSPNNVQHSDHHLSDAFNNYLDCDVVDNVGTGLPPDDSILDLFER